MPRAVFGSCERNFPFERTGVGISSRGNKAQRSYVLHVADRSANHRAVIQALLNGDADANRRYHVEAHHLAEWTPTLFAAQTGDLETFRMLVEHPGNNRGDPELSLIAPTTLERFDALWVAIDHGRHAIASYLM